MGSFCERERVGLNTISSFMNIYSLVIKFIPSTRGQQ